MTENLYELTREEEIEIAREKAERAITINKNRRDEKFGLEKKLSILENGKSKVFEKWEKYGLITKEEFKEALIWLCNDPLSDRFDLTRQISLDITLDMRNKILDEKYDGKYGLNYDESNLKGKIVKLERRYRYSKDNQYEELEKREFIGYYDIETGFGHRADAFTLDLAPYDNI